MLNMYTTNTLEPVAPAPAASSATTGAMDDYLRTSWPVTTMPRSGVLQPMDHYGERYVLARDMLYLQVQRSWLSALLPLTTQPMLKSTPFGPSPGLQVVLLCGRPPREMFQRFVAQARAALPNESACLIAWHPQQGWHYIELEPLSGSARHLSSALIRYKKPVIPEGYSVVVDLHSHAGSELGTSKTRSAFSATDEIDDCGRIQISAVIGTVSADARHPIETEMVLRCLGLSYRMPQSDILELDMGATLRVRRPIEEDFDLTHTQARLYYATSTSGESDAQEDFTGA